MKRAAGNMHHLVREGGRELPPGTRAAPRSGTPNLAPRPATVGQSFMRLSAPAKPRATSSFILSDFVVAAAQEAAHKTIEEANIIGFRSKINGVLWIFCSIRIRCRLP